jgi:hypothetical protein
VEAVGIAATRRNFLIPTFDIVSLRHDQFHLLDGTTFHISYWRMPYKGNDYTLSSLVTKVQCNGIWGNIKIKVHEKD